ncbi:MAG: AAA family ATPase, partial [Cetobacterium sp.]
YDALASLYPNLPELLSSTIGQMYNDELAGILAGYANSASKVRGRSGTKIDTKDAAVADSDLTGGEKKYDRPNGDAYWTRSWGAFDDVLVLRKARETNQFTMLYGAPGCGKTALVEAAFPDLITVLGSGDTEVADLVGGYVQTEGGKWLWTDGPLIVAATEGRPLLLDEVGLIDPKVLSIIYGLMDGRREYTVTANPERGTVHAQPGFYVIGATNPNAPGVRLSEALVSRFVVQVEMTTDWALTKKLGVAAPMVTAAQNLAKKQSSGEVSWAPQFRELLAFRDLEKTFGTAWAVANLLAAAPEIDRPVVADVLTRTYGEAILPARI